ncbi:MAG: prepilin-type N-terminal cleavage/methylation domain-containing protein [Phycisphaerales bacterium]|nr:prepilin-type N-terminal cleavage/methylation domain-containing protein [Phycisphaerales bacterium]
MIPQRNIQHRHGFTLVELTTSLAITAILMLGLASVLLIGSKAVPSGTEQIHTEAACANMLEDIAEDLALASGLTLVSPQEITLGVADRDGDGSKDQITYAYDSDAGTIKRTWNSDDAVTILSDVSAFAVSLKTSDGKASLALVELTSTATTTPSQSIRVELYNDPEVR